MRSAVALVSPKFPRNVGNVLRACSNFGAEALSWSPERVDHPENWPAGSRLPREERMKLYSEVAFSCEWQPNLITPFVDQGYVPVAVEVRQFAWDLPTFEHPDDALYVFGPEDGELGRGILTACHQFVVIPSTSCLNLAAAVNVVLYDRVSKNEQWRDLVPHGQVPRPLVGVDE